MLLKLLISVWFLLTMISFGISQIIEPGEELIYEASFLGIVLGEVKIETSGFEIVEGDSTVKAEVLIESSGVAGLAKTKYIFTAWMDTTLSFARKSMIKYYHSGVMDHEIIDYCYRDEKIRIDKFKEGDLTEKKEFETSKKYNEGVSLLFLIRKHIDLKRKLKIPIIIDSDTTVCELSFYGKPDLLDCSHIGYPVRTLYMAGEMGESELFGLKGKLKVWVSEDDVRVPVKASFNIIIGDIVLTLKKWNRGDWKPPRAE